MRKANKSGGTTVNMEAEVLRYAKMDNRDLTASLHTSAERGLESAKTEALGALHGENIIDYGKTQPWFVRLLLSFANPFSLVLLLVAGVSFVTEVLLASDKSWATVIIILALVGISGILQFVQESKSDKAAEKLKAMVSSNAAVIRDGVEREMPMREILPGDVVKLSAGDMIPADVRILSAKDLFVGQAALTGESEPIEKFPAFEETDNALDASNICYMGTNVVSGSTLAVVFATGNRTYLGSIAKDLTGRKAQTSFEKGVADVSRLLLRLMLIMVPVIFLINGFSKNDWIGALLFALAVAVGIAPELLPMIMSSTLAKGAVSMSRRKTIVKNLSSIQSFGAMDVLCTDKTGTLTEDRIVLERYLDIQGNEDLRVWRHAYLNSYFQTGLKNLIDIAIINRAEKEGYETWDDIYTKVDEIPFDFNRRRMSVVLEDESGKRQLITKGAVEELLSISSFAEYKGEVIPLTEDIREEVLALTDGLNEQGLRVVAVAQKNNVRDTKTFGVSDEGEMVLIGFVGFLDPPKESSKEAIAALHEHGVRVVVLTGDNEKVARTVCGQVGLDASEYLLGSGIDGLSDEELTGKVQTVNLFAKLSPSQKVRVVRLLQEQGHTVGYMGDGINDAPALHQADVGISVDSGVDIAKESADIILLEKSLMVLEEGVVEGRRTFGNIIKYIKMASSGNFGNMFSVLVSSLFLPFLPMLPIQILAQNLLYDFSQITIPFDRMDEEYIKRPQKWDAKNVERFMYWFGPVSSLFDILSFIVLFWVFKANTAETQDIFQTGWFMVGLLTQTLIVHLIRTAKIPFVQSKAAMPLILSTIAVCIAGIIIPYTPLGTGLGMTAMPALFIPWLLGIVLLYAVVVQLLKKVYIKRYGNLI
ncbi:MAG: magnesium-translocating P-type ATPase [Firmicutes bacterium]|nr:magnesium-translocating P-type ATPase [Bacillota bacterium]